MSQHKKRIKATEWLRPNTQTELAAIFGKTQSWVSKILKDHPGAELVFVDGEITEIEYSVEKTKKRKV